MLYIALLFKTPHKSPSEIIGYSGRCNKLAVESHIRDWLDKGMYAMENITVFRVGEPLKFSATEVKYLQVLVNDGR